jgi:Cu2+-exporting ATPase
VFDKTGTLTEGKLSVVSIYWEEGDWQAARDTLVPAEVKDLFVKLAAVERLSEHPAAQAVLAWVETQGLPNTAVKASDFNYQPGMGVVGKVEGQQVLTGNSAWLDANQVIRQPRFDPIAEQLAGEGVGSVRVALGGREAALLAIEDRIRPEAAGMLIELRTEGMELTLLSGDRRPVAEAIARRLGGMEVIAEVLPEDKDQVIRKLQAGGHKVAMVGDGVNDAPALVRADVGIAMGSGTDVSIASADVVLMQGDLQKVRLAIGLSRRTLLTIRQNIAISIVYNVIMVPLAMAAIVTPLVAAISMPLSSLAVIGNSARIRTLFKDVSSS